MLQLGAKPGQEDGPAPASGKTLFGFQRAKNGFVWRKILP